MTTYTCNLADRRWGCWKAKIFHLQDYEYAVIHQHTSRRRLSVEAQRSSAEEATGSPKSEAGSSEDGLLAMSVWEKIKLLLSDPELIVFLLMAILFGFATGAIDGYLFLYLDSLGEAWTLKIFRKHVKLVDF